MRINNLQCKYFTRVLFECPIVLNANPDLHLRGRNREEAEKIRTGNRMKKSECANVNKRKKMQRNAEKWRNVIRAMPWHRSDDVSGDCRLTPAAAVLQRWQRLLLL
jgi:hypothetical protein